MTKSTLGDLVAAEMSKIVDSEEHVSMFSKVAKKKEDKSEDVKDKKDKKSEKSEKSNPFAKKDKKDKEDDKESKKKDKKSEKSEKSDKTDKAKKDKKEEKKDDKKKEMTSESMNSFVNLLTKASDTLDNYGLHKSAILTLQALDTLIGEVAMDKFANLSEDLPEGVEGLGDFADDPEMARLLDMGKNHGGGSDIDPMFLAELEQLDTGEPTAAFEDLDEADDTSILDELGLSGSGETESDEGSDLGEPLPELEAFVEDDETRKVFSKLDSWMIRHAYEGYGHTDGDLMADDDDEFIDGVDSKSPDTLIPFDVDPKIYRRYDDMLADVNLPKEVLLDSVPSGKLDWGDDGDDIDEVIHDVNDHREYGSEDEERAILQKLLTTDPDEDEDELAEGIRTALTTDPDADENYYADDEDIDFEDE